MLKRRRAPSPGPSSSEVPFLASDPLNTASTSKRRRVLPPTMDGQFRGTPSADDEGDYYEDEMEEYGQDNYYRNPSKGAIGGDPIGVQWQDSSGEYKNTNTLLHQLHIEHCRRMAGINGQAGHIGSFPAYSEVNVDSAALPYRSASDPNQQQQSQQQPLFRTAPMSSHESHKEQTLYDHNKQLGSLFLSRRKDAEAAGERHA